MAVLKLKCILLMLIFVTYISNTYGRGGRGGGGRGSSSSGRGSGSRGGSYSGGRGSSYGGSSSSGSRVGTSSSGGKSSVSSGTNTGQGSYALGSVNSRRAGSSYRSGSRRHYGYSGSGRSDYEDSDYPFYTSAPWRYNPPRKSYHEDFKPYTTRYPIRNIEVPKFEPVGSGFSHRKMENPEEKILNDFWSRVGDFKVDGKTIGAREFLNSPEFSKQWYKAELITRSPRIKRAITL